MVKIRIIPILLMKGVGLVKGVSFDSDRRIGSALQSVRVFNFRNVDELVIFDINATPHQESPDYKQIEEMANECFMPLTVGGGVTSVENIQLLLQAGADKVSINSAAANDPDLIRKGVNLFGCQCIVGCIDVKKTTSGYRVFTHNGTQETNWEPADYAVYLETLGVGEIILTSIDRDGTMLGYDLELIKNVASVVSVPLVASGGAGSYDDLNDVLKVANISGLCASSIFQFTECTPAEARDYLAKQGHPVRKC